MKSQIIESEWFSGAAGIVGAVLTWNEHDGFKVRIGVASLSGEQSEDEETDSQFLADHGAKVSVDVAIGIFGGRIYSENIRKNLHTDMKKIKYDGREYDRERFKK